MPRNTWRELYKMLQLRGIRLFPAGLIPQGVANRAAGQLHKEQTRFVPRSRLTR